MDLLGPQQVGPGVDCGQVGLARCMMVRRELPGERRDMFAVTGNN